MANAKELYNQRDTRLPTQAVAPSFAHTNARLAVRQASREDVVAKESHSVSAQDCDDYEKNLRKITSAELRRSYDEFQLRDTTSPTCVPCIVVVVELIIIIIETAPFATTDQLTIFVLHEQCPC